MSKRYTELYRFAKFLRENLLPEVPIHVKRMTLTEKKWADCGPTSDLKAFAIRIDRRIKEEYSLFFLMHEFAHVLAWDKQQKDHGVEWGKAMSKVFCAYVKWIGYEPTAAAACSKKKCGRHPHEVLACAKCPDRLL